MWNHIIWIRLGKFSSQFYIFIYQRLVKAHIQNQRFFNLKYRAWYIVDLVCTCMYNGLIKSQHLENSMAP